jgi:hypothetical protein
MYLAGAGSNWKIAGMSYDAPSNTLTVNPVTGTLFTSPVTMQNATLDGTLSFGTSAYLGSRIPLAALAVLEPQTTGFGQVYVRNKSGVNSQLIVDSPSGGAYTALQISNAGAVTHQFAVSPTLGPNFVVPTPFLFGSNTATGSAAAVQVFGGTMQLVGFITPPACNATCAGCFNYSGHSVGVKDAVQVCAADSTNTWAWRTIY